MRISDWSSDVCSSDLGFANQGRAAAPQCAAGRRHDRNRTCRCGTERGRRHVKKASDLFIECLEEEGVEYIFGVPGEENLDFLDSLSRSKSIRMILTRHEQGAGFMAATYGRSAERRVGKECGSKGRSGWWP